MKNFSVQLAMKVNFSKPNEAEDFYIKGKALFADEEDKLWIWKGVETSVSCQYCHTSTPLDFTADTDND